MWPLLITLLLLLGSTGMWAQPVTAALPQRTVNTTLTAAQLSLLQQAAQGDQCNGTVAHVHCTGFDPSDDWQQNGLRFLGAAPTCAPTGAFAAALAALQADGSSDEVVVMEAGHIYAHAACTVPSIQGSTAASCGTGESCSFLMPPTPQSPTNWANNTHKKIFIISSHYNRLPPQGTRLIPVAGDGYSSPLGYVPNIAPSSYTTISPDLFGMSTTNLGGLFLNVPSDSADIIQFGNRADDYVIIGAEFVNNSMSGTSTNSFVGELGNVISMVSIRGKGAQGTRTIYVKWPATAAAITGNGALYQDTGIPQVVKCHIGSPTGPPCSVLGGPTASVLPNTPVNVYFDALNTHFVAGRSFIQFTWIENDWPSTAVAVNALTSTQCAAGATPGGNAVVGNLCVTNGTHAWTSITSLPNPHFNGGVFAYTIDTVPAQTLATAAPACPDANGAYGTGGVGGTWCAGTEHAFSYDALIAAYDASGKYQFTVNCANPPQTGCFNSPVDGAMLISNDGAAHPVVVQANQNPTTGAWLTNWTSTYIVNFGLASSSGSAFLGALYQTGTPVVSADLHSITGVSVNNPFPINGVAYTTSPIVLPNDMNKGTTGSNTGIPPDFSPSAEIGAQYKTLMSLCCNGTGIDFVGTARQQVVMYSPGVQNTVDVYGYNTNWTGINCQPGSVSVVNFGPDIAIDSCTAISPTHMQVTYTPCDGVTTNNHSGCSNQTAASQGSNNVWIMRSYVHNKSGEILHTGHSYPNSTDPFISPFAITGGTITNGVLTANTSPNNNLVGGETLYFWAFPTTSPLSVLNYQTVTVNPNPTSTSFTASVPSLPNATDTSTAHTVTSGTIGVSGAGGIATMALNLSAPLSAVPQWGQFIFLYGFPTSTFLNNKWFMVQKGPTATPTNTSRINVLIGQHPGVTISDSGTMAMLGMAGIPCRGSGAWPTTHRTWVCFHTAVHGTFRMLLMDGNGAALEDSYAADTTHLDLQGDHQGISAFAGAGPMRVYNNYLSADTENVLQGGSGSPVGTGWISGPDPEYSYNYMYKPPWWYNAGIHFAPANTGATACNMREDGNRNCSVNIKDIFELKSGVRTYVHHNLLDGDWPGWFQAYIAMVLTPIIGQSRPSAYVDDTTVVNNVFININGWFSKVSSDATSGCIYAYNHWARCGFGANQNVENRRTVIRNNLVLSNQTESTFVGATPQTTEWGLISPGTHDTAIDHNTVMLMTGITTTKATLFFNSPVPAPPSGSYNTWITNNVATNCNQANGSTIASNAYKFPNANSTLDITARYRGGVCVPRTSADDAALPATNSFTVAPSFTTAMAASCVGNNSTNTPAGSTLTCWCTSPACGTPGTLNGNYSLTGPAGWVAPSTNTTDGTSSGFISSTLTWTPQAYYGSPSITVPTFTLSGNVSGAGTNTVTLRLGGAGAGTTTTNSSGNYSFPNLTNGTYTVTPVLAGYNFNPAMATVTINNANATGVNFTATIIITTFTISGQVTGDVQAGVTITLSGGSMGSTVTNASGNYSFTSLPNGTYRLVPSLTGYSFNPTGASITVSGANVTQNFVASKIIVIPPVGWNPVHIGPNISLLPPGVLLTWTTSVTAGVTSQCIYRGTVSGGENYTNPVTCFQSSSANTFTDVGGTLAYGTTYYYTMQAFIGSTASGPSNETSVFIPAPPARAVPESLSDQLRSQQQPDQ